MSTIAPDDHAPIPFIDRYNVFKRFSLIFNDNQLEQQYIADYAGKVSGQARLALVLAFVLYVNFALLDYLLVPESMYQLWTIRAVTCSLFIISFAITFSELFKKHHQLFLMLSGFSTAAGIFCMLLITRNNVNHYYYEGINLCITWTLFIVGLRFFNALRTVVVIIAVYNIIAFYKQLMLTEIISHNFFLISNAVIGIFAGYTIEQHSRWQFYQALVIQKNSRRLHQAMLEASVDSVISVDESGAVVEFNQSAESMFGYTRKEAIGQRIATLIIPEHLRARREAGFARFFRRANKNVTGIRIEIDAMRKDGSCFPVEIILREVNLIGRWLVTAYIRDLTAQRDADTEIMRQREVLQRNEKLSALGALLAGVAHELNNPLSVVLGQAQLLTEIEQDDRVLKRAGKISHAADRCAKVVQTFLSMARQKPPQRTLVNLNDVIADALDLLDYGLRTRGIDIVLELQDALPSINADSDQLHQVVTNLVLNAQHAMQDSAKKCLTLRTFFSVEKYAIYLEIIDTGPGVPADMRHRIFEPFFTTKAVGVGTGLGLSVCNGIIEAHGGAIHVVDAGNIVDANNVVDIIDKNVSTHNGGACFVVHLPITQQTTGQNISDQNLVQLNENNKALTIVVADDESDIIEWVNEVLTHAGHHVFCASNGDAAFELIKLHSPHIIVSDFRMPVMSGPELFAAVVQQWPHLQKRFIFMTGDILTVDNTDFLHREDAPVLEKPFTSQQLFNLIASTIQQGEIAQ